MTPATMQSAAMRRSGAYVTDGPLIVQSDKTVLLESTMKTAGAARAAIAPFAELERARVCPPTASHRWHCGMLAPQP